MSSRCKQHTKNPPDLLQGRGGCTRRGQVNCLSRVGYLTRRHARRTLIDMQLLLGGSEVIRAEHSTRATGRQESAVRVGALFSPAGARSDELGAGQPRTCAQRTSRAAIRWSNGHAGNDVIGRITDCTFALVAKRNVSRACRGGLPSRGVRRASAS